MWRTKGILAGLLLAATMMENINAIEGITITKQGTNAVILWPSIAGEKYIIQSRTTFDPTNEWVTLTNAYPAATGTNRTAYIILGVVKTNTTSGGGGGSGGPPNPLMMQSGNNFSSGSFNPLPELPPLPWEPEQTANNGKLNQFATLQNQSQLQSLTTPDWQVESKFYRVVRQGIHLVGVTNGSTFSGDVLIPMEVGSTNQPITGLHLNSFGEPLSGITVITNGPLFFKWHTPFSESGIYDIYPQADLAVGELIGKTNEIELSNLIAFTPVTSMFGEVLYIYAEVDLPVYDAQIDIYDEDGDYILSFFGEELTGNISFQWNLTDLNDQILTNESFRGEFFVQEHTHTLSPPRSGTATNRWTKDTGWAEDGFIIAWGHTGRINTPSRIEKLVARGVVNILANPARSDLYLTNPESEFGTDSVFRLTAGTKTNLLAHLADKAYRNFYWFGHGTPSTFGDFGEGVQVPVSISTGEIRLALNNYLGDEPGAPVAHPYRFVFLDGCKTTEGHLPEAFGIHQTPTSTGFYVSGLGIKPRAFIGFSTTVSLPSSQTQHDYYQNMIAIFFDRWMNNFSIDDSLVNATQHPNWPLTNTYKIFGATNLFRSAP